MSIIDILFWFLSALTIVGAIMVIVSKNPVYSVLWLIAVFFAISGHYILLNAQFLAIVNLIVYAGAIMVLFLFVIMLMNPGNNQVRARRSSFSKFAAVISGGALLLVLVGVFRSSAELYTRVQGTGHTPKLIELKTGNIGLIEVLGKSLFNEYVVPFEISSILFLSAMVGAVVLGKKE